MDGLKIRAGEKLEALHGAAITAADIGKSRVEDVVNQTIEAVRRLREAFNDIWHNELIAEARQKVSAWTRDTANRIREGAPPLSPVLLYEELVALLKDRVWRRSMLVFGAGVLVGGAAGAALGARLASRANVGPHARALHSQGDQTVILVDDAVTPAAGYGEVLVRVQAFSVSTVDRCVLRGHAATLRSLLSTGDLTVGRGFAGVILDVGEGVNNLEMGDEVWGCISEWSGGAAAELLTVRSTRVSKRPRNISADTAASLPWAGGAALSALYYLRYNADNCKGKRVCICGASSEEGCVLVQLLSAWGATVFVAAPRQSAFALKDLGASEYIDSDEHSGTVSWTSLEMFASRRGPWDALVTCANARVPNEHPANTAALLKATAPRNSVIDLRPRSLISDRLPAPFSLIFALSFYSFRVLRWLTGYGSHTDWLEDRHRMTLELQLLTELVDQRVLNPVLDKVYLPQDFESALAHACSDDAFGTTVIRFP